MSSDVVISARNLTKTYRLFGHPGDRIKQFLSLGMRQYHREFTALQDVSFDVYRGEMVGIIGRNGSGKSTLLQLICGILKPAAGAIAVNGRISALLELGAGFNPEFTGKENIYFLGALNGLDSMEINSRYGAIAAFADIGDFIDQPVRTYSSGMYVRLAFSVAIHTTNDILVVDEALAVGDAEFQGKCFRYMKAFRDQGGTILFVTHALEQVAHFCHRTLWLNAGRLLADGPTESTLTSYLNNQKSKGEVSYQKTNTEKPDKVRDELSSHPGYNPSETRWGDSKAQIVSALIKQDGQDNPAILSPGLPTELILQLRFHADVDGAIFGLAIKSLQGALLFSINSQQLSLENDKRSWPAGACVTARFTFQPFLDSGDYFVSLGVVGDAKSGIEIHDRRYDVLRIRIAMPRTDNGYIDMKPTFHVLETT